MKSTKWTVATYLETPDHRISTLVHLEYHRQSGCCQQYNCFLCATAKRTHYSYTAEATATLHVNAVKRQSVEISQALLQQFSIGPITHFQILTNSCIIRERTIIGSVSYRNRYWLYRIESATVVSADITCITAGSSTVDGSHYTRWSKGVQATRHPPSAHARVRAVLWSMIRESVGGDGSGRRL